MNKDQTLFNLAINMYQGDRRTQTWPSKLKRRFDHSFGDASPKDMEAINVWLGELPRQHFEALAGMDDDVIHEILQTGPDVAPLILSLLFEEVVP